MQMPSEDELPVCQVMRQVFSLVTSMFAVPLYWLPSGFLPRTS